MLKMLGLKTETLISDKEIIHNFYKKAKKWIAKNPKKYDIQEPSDLLPLWKKYTNSLSLDQKTRAQSLSHVVINESQTLPENFTYTEALKAILLLAIPDLLILKHLDVYPNGRGTTYDLCFNNTYAKQKDGTYLLTPKKMRLQSAFVKFIIQGEMNLKDKSQLCSFSDYLDSLLQSNMHSFRDYNLKFVDHFIKNIYPLLTDSKLKNALEVAGISIVDQITTLHELSTNYLTAYTLARSPSAPSEEDKTKSLTESMILEQTPKRLKQSQIVTHNAIALKINYKFTVGSTKDGEPIRQYERNAIRNIDIGLRPVTQSSSEENFSDDADRQNYIYTDAVEYRKASITQDGINLPTYKELLGANDEQSYQDFIPDDYQPSFACVNLHNTISNNDLLMHFFLDNATILQKFDDSEHRDMLKASMERCWKAFVKSEKCSEEIKKRNIVLEKSTVFFTVLNIVSKICQSDFRDLNTIIAFSKLLKDAAQEKKNKLLVALAKVFFIHENEIKITTKKTNNIKEEITNAISTIIWSDLPEEQRNEFINHHHTLQSLLSDAWGKVHIKEIASQCTEKKLETLAKELEKFSAPGNDPTLFGAGSTASSLQKVIDMIHNGKHGASDILLLLKQTTQHVKENARIDSLISELYHVMNDFFSKNNAEENNTMDSLLDRISQISAVIVAANANLSDVSTFSQGPK